MHPPCYFLPSLARFAWYMWLHVFRDFALCLLLLLLLLLLNHNIAVACLIDLGVQDILKWSLRGGLRRRLKEKPGPWGIAAVMTS